MMTGMPDKKDKFDFKKSYTKLQEIVRKFEQGDVDLEEGLKWFEEGMKHVHELRKYMQTMEHRIKELKSKYHD